MISRILIILLFVAGCASTPIAQGPLIPADFERWSVHVLTWDADGDRRKTRVWIAAVRGIPYLRTARTTRWWKNIERGSPTQILAGDQIFSVSIERIDTPSLRAQIDEAFSAKYGWLGKLVIDEARAQSDDPYLRLVPASGAVHVDISQLLEDE
ncbi:MAG: DUF2255 family protein [bacterium]|nr:DUF2255 family protein [bacterium]